MAFSIRDAMIKAGMAQAPTKPKKVRQRYEPAPDKPNPPPFEAPPIGQVVKTKSIGPRVQMSCVECDRTFFPDDLEHKQFGRYEECGPCAKEYDKTERLQGEMIFDHKTAPTLEIKGRPCKLTPEEIASMRRR
jgi:hypothetical protein